MRCLFAFAALSVVCIAQADDGILYYHGNPKLLKGNTQIRMIQEFVRAKIGKSTARVYCRFLFRNDGPATMARIGFPDGSDHDGESIGDPRYPPKPDLSEFRSCVDGKPVATRLEKTDLNKTPYAFFHVKTVRFGKKQTRVVEDWYETPLDMNAVNAPNYYVRGFQYTMESGASWKGTIGNATIQIDFQGRLRQPHPVDPSKYGNPYTYAHWERIPKNYVFWEGFAQPKHVGSSLLFSRKRFKPNRNSNIKLVFGPHRGP